MLDTSRDNFHFVDRNQSSDIQKTVQHVLTFGLLQNKTADLDHRCTYMRKQEVIFLLSYPLELSNPE